MKTRTGIVLSILIVALLGVVLFDYHGLMSWSVAYELPITASANGRSLAPEHVASVSYTWSVPADSAADVLLSDDLDLPKKAEAKGNAFIARVPSGGRVSGLGRELAYFRPPRICVRVRLKDGRTVGVICPTPGRHEKRALSIDIGKRDAQPAAGP